MKKKTYRVAHIADCHLRTRQYKMGSRGHAFLVGLKNAIRAAKGAKADCVVCAGDLFDAVNPGSDICLRQLDEVDSLLKELKLRMYTVSGNHDTAEPSWFSRYRDADGIVDINNRSGYIHAAGSPVIAGIPYMDAISFSREVKSLVDTADIVVWHGALKEFCGYPPADSASMEDIPMGRACLIALGDQHVHRHIVRPDGSVVAYPGSTELCSADEEPSKSMYVYTLKAGEDGRFSVAKVEDVPFETQPVQRFSVDSEDSLESAMAEMSPGALVFVSVGAGALNARDRLISRAIELGDCGAYRTTVVVTPEPRKRETIVLRDDACSNRRIKTPSEFVMERTSDLFGEGDEAPRLANLSACILDPVFDHKKAIDAFCAERLDGVTVI